MKSFLQGKKAVDGEALRPPPGFGLAATPRCTTPGAPNADNAAASAQVEVVKEGDKVVRLIVSCVCGERIEIDCLYAPGR